MRVYIVFRPEDHLVLGVFSTEDYAATYRKSCGGGGCDTIVSSHIVDEDVADLLGVEV